MATPTSVPISVSTLAGNELFLRSMSGDESMNGMFSFDVQVLCKNGDIKLGEALGTSLTIAVPLKTGGGRFFNGLITRFSRVGQIGSFFLFRLQLHPWLWLLSRNADLRIFQNRSVVEILNKIFRKYPLNSFDQALGTYKPREFLVQYRETDLNFISRLMEDQGIAGHYIHTSEQHKLMLTDSITNRLTATGYEQIPLQQPSQAGGQESFISWNVSQEIQPDAYILKDFDYKAPKAQLVSQLPPQSTPDFNVSGEIYDYPGNYLDNDAGDRLVGLRRQQGQTYYETFQGSGAVRGVGAGNVFKLSGPLVGEPGRQYLITRAHYDIRCPPPESNTGTELPETFTCTVDAVDATIPFRLPRLTPIPVVQGPQTATVVDPQKDVDNPTEIWTDELGRVLVEFHWERTGALKAPDPERNKDDANDNQKAPCWLRVAELWAGTGFGTVFTPRIGQEVIVEFLEGNPDRPIITGRLYNGTNKPPYLDERKDTQSGIKTRSTPQGTPKNFNELRFDDKIGEEEVFIQAEKNQNNNVKNNRSATVGASDSVSVGGDRSVTVNGNLSVRVNGGGKSATHSLYKVTGKHSLDASDCIDFTAKNFIKLQVDDGTFVEIKPGQITLHVEGGGEIVLTGKVDAHSQDGKSKLLLDGNAKLSTDGEGSLVAKQKASIEGQELAATSHSKATLEGVDTTVKGSGTAVVEGGKSKTISDAAGISATGTVINLNSG